MNPQLIPLISVVVIGRNEGDRLVRCLESIQAAQSDRYAMELIYVDSASTDGSPERAKSLGAQVMTIQSERPSAAIGRNAGWRAAIGEHVLFLDGDTVLHPQFISHALQALHDPEIAIVWGHRRESAPGQSCYVRVLDLDWIYAPGPSAFCGGDALMRKSVLEEVGGFDPGLIAGEEPELCRRIRAKGHRIEHIDAPMTQHDLAIQRFGPYWKRAFRAGHAYAEVAARFRYSDDPLWQSEVKRNMIHGGALVLFPFVLLTALGIPTLFWTLLCASIALLLRTAWRCRWKTSNKLTCLLYAIHSHFQQIPILMGQLSQRRDTRHGKTRQLIDYKQTF